VTSSLIPLKLLRRFAAVGLLCLPASAQQPVPPVAAPPAEKPAEKPATPETPAQIELLETHIRLEANGDSRKEVHTRVRINSELGVRQFSHLNFDFNRSFEQIEIPQVHITHKSGGTADILPRAITDQPNPAVTDAPAYQDVRVKSVRILGLSPGDTLEYRVVTSIAHGPFSPNFYLSHDFANHDVVTREIFLIDLPASPAIKPWTSQAAQTFDTQQSGEASDPRRVYRWERPPQDHDSHNANRPQKPDADLPQFFVDSDVVLTTFENWSDLLRVLQRPIGASETPSPEIKAKAAELTRGTPRPEDKLRGLYDFVSQKITTVALPIGATGFHLRPSAAILSSGYATAEEKCSLLSALAASVTLGTNVALVIPGARSERGPAIPTIFTNVLLVARAGTRTFWLDPSVDVAPFGMIASNIRGKPALPLSPVSDINLFENVPDNIPFPSSQRVRVDATIAEDGTLNAKVKYSMRGDNELLLRAAFHQSPRDKWKEVAQLLALSDGFRGKIISASASDPYATKQAFTVEYQISQPKFVDWSKKPVSIPALLPQLGIPEIPPKPESGTAASSIDLGTPLDVDTRVTLRLPPGTNVEVPTGTVVDRDYATFASRYNTQNGVITANRHINFLHRQVPADRSGDYAAFLHAVQTDQSQRFTLTRPESATAPAINKSSSHP
jgi:Domain of Unknown Function with PDB structure (DUF3857)